MQFKLKPEDFIVKESCNLKLKDTGKYGYFLLKKRNYTTTKAIDIICKVLRISKDKVNYSGLKDKNSISEQYISVYSYNKGKFEWKIEGLSIKFIGYGSERINLGFSESNSFVIIVREINERKKLNCDFLENYFDEQRFGKENLNIKVGKSLIKKNFGKACEILGLDAKNNDFIGALRSINKKILRLYIHSYQSYLFNQALKEYIKSKSKESYTKNGFLFSKSRLNNIKIPLINFNTKFNDKLIEKIYLKILKKERVDKKDFLIREMPELISLSVERDAFVLVKDFKYDYRNKSECIISFTLPKGTYATVLIKKLFD